jgi:hypothetical protein
MARGESALRPLAAQVLDTDDSQSLTCEELCVGIRKLVRASDSLTHTHWHTCTHTRARFIDRV